MSGVANVLSTPRIAPRFRGAAQITSRSPTVSSGFEGDSSQIRSASAHSSIHLAVSATPTRGTVDFYMSQGFMPVATPHERLYALEPDDVHMERVL